eukprot:scaffold3725_cov376-Prasinococcus_capsulatus_cf.AAC.5
MPAATRASATARAASEQERSVLEDMYELAALGDKVLQVVQLAVVVLVVPCKERAVQVARALAHLHARQKGLEVSPPHRVPCGTMSACLSSLEAAPSLAIPWSVRAPRQRARLGVLEGHDDAAVRTDGGVGVLREQAAPQAVACGWRGELEREVGGALLVYVDEVRDGVAHHRELQVLLVSLACARVARRQQSVTHVAAA